MVFKKLAAIVFIFFLPTKGYSLTPRQNIFVLGFKVFCKEKIEKYFKNRSDGDKAWYKKEIFQPAMVLFESSLYDRPLKNWQVWAISQVPKCLDLRTAIFFNCYNVEHGLQLNPHWNLKTGDLIREVQKQLQAGTKKSDQEVKNASLKIKGIHDFLKEKIKKEETRIWKKRVKEACKRRKMLKR